MPALSAPATATRLKARDCMSAPVLAVGLDATARHAAELMIRKGFSGLPVVDAERRPVGLVSEADFVFGAAEGRKHRQETWLRLISEGQSVNDDYLDLLDKELGEVRRFMATPVIGVEADAPLDEVVRRMAAHGVRRVIVTQDGKLAGVVTRRDLLRVVSPAQAEPPPRPESGLPAPCLPPPPAAAPARPTPTAGAFAAATLRALVGAHERAQDDLRKRAADETSRQRAAEVAALLEAPVSEAEWARLLADARRLAAQGARQCAMLRSPAALCEDGGRAVNAPDPEWPASLRGKAARMYLRWRDELKPEGFRLAAQIVSFPDGLPGDVEMTLIWGGADLS